MFILEDANFQVHLGSPPNSRNFCCVDNYFKSGLLAWEANMDIQPVINHYKALIYVCTYLNKEEEECSRAMAQAVKEVWDKSLNNYEQMKLIIKAYATKRECSVQAVYHIMSELWLKKIFPALVFANTNLPENCFRVCFSEQEIKEVS